jgi:hypothetical protein
MNVQLYCIFSFNLLTQKYIDQALRSTSSYSVYQAIFSGDEVVYYPIKCNTPLNKIGFVIPEYASEIIKLKSKGVNFICLDDNLGDNFTNYEFLNPTIMLSGTVKNWLMPEYFLIVLNKAIRKSYRMTIRFNMGIDFFLAKDEENF